MNLWKPLCDWVSSLHWNCRRICPSDVFSSLVNLMSTFPSVWKEEIYFTTASMLYWRSWMLLPSNFSISNAKEGLCSMKNLCIYVRYHAAWWPQPAVCFKVTHWQVFQHNGGSVWLITIILSSVNAIMLFFFFKLPTRSKRGQFANQF